MFLLVNKIIYISWIYYFVNCKCVSSIIFNIKLMTTKFRENVSIVINEERYASFCYCVKIYYTCANICILYIKILFYITFSTLLKKKELCVCHEYRSYVHNSHSASMVQYIKFLTRNLLKKRC